MKQVFILVAVSIFVYSCNISQDEKETIAQTIVAGRILDYDADQTELTIINTSLCVDEKREMLSIDNSGYFHYSFKNNVVRDLRFILNRANFLILVYPGDSVFVEFTTKTNEFWESINITGDRKDENTLIVNFQHTFQKSLDRNYIARQIPKLNEIQFIQYMDSIQENSMQIVDTFIRRNNPSKSLNHWIKWHASEPYYYYLWLYPTETEIEVSSDYYDFYNNLLPIQMDDLFATHNLGLFIRGYFTSLILPNVISDNAQLIEKWQQDEDLYKKEERIADSLMNVGIVKYSNGTITKDLVLTYWYSVKIRNGYLEAYEYYKDNLDDEISIEFLRTSLYDYYHTVKSNIENPPTAISIISEIEVISIRKTLDSIFNSKKGDILVFDFWATWCSPCIANFASMNSVIDEFEGKPVTFVFFCLDGSENKNKWSDIIKRHKVKGIHLYLDEKEAREIRKIFEIGSIPHYSIFDKNGKLRKNGRFHHIDDELITLLDEDYVP